MTSPFDTIADIIVVPLLRSPLHHLISRRLMLVQYTGRTSGIVFHTPVKYKREGKTIFFFVRRDHVWWKNLLDGASVSLHLSGHNIKGVARRLSQNELVIVDYLLRMYPRMTYDEALKTAYSLVLAEIQLLEEPATRAPAATTHPVR